MRAFPIEKNWIFGAVSFKDQAKGTTPWRIPFKEYALFETHPNCKFESLQKSASESAGMRLQVQTNATQIGLHVAPNLTESDILYDLTIDNKLIQTAAQKPGQNEIMFTDLPAAEKEVHIWLPMSHPTTLINLLINTEATVKSVDDKRIKWITHGSSITHCRGAYSPAKTWPAVVARERNLNLTSLGYGAGCHLDQHTARIIRDIEADFISLKIGINIIIVGSLSWRTFRQNVTGFIKTIREKHETTPIAVVSPIIAPNFEKAKNCVNMTLEEMRDELFDAVERYQQVFGDKNIRSFDGLKLLPTSAIGTLENFLHPDGREYEIMGHNFTTQVYDQMMK